MLAAIASFFGALSLGLFVAGYTLEGSVGILVLGSVVFSAGLLFIPVTVLIIVSIVTIAFALAALIYDVFFRRLKLYGSPQ